MLRNKFGSKFVTNCSHSVCTGKQLLESLEIIFSCFCDCNLYIYVLQYGRNISRFAERQKPVLLDLFSHSVHQHFPKEKFI